MTKIDLAKSVIRKIKGNKALPCNLSLDLGNGEIHNGSDLIALSRSELLYLISLQVDNKELFTRLKPKPVDFSKIYAELAIEEYCSFYEILAEVAIKHPKIQVPEYLSKDELLKKDISAFSGSSEHLDNYINGFAYILNGILSGTITDKDVDAYFYYYEYEDNDFSTPLKDDVLVKNRLLKLHSQSDNQ